MKFTDVFVRRPVLALVVNLVIVIAGLQAVRSLNVRQYPKLESATVAVRTAYIGANADLVRGFITTPLERAIAAADGIDYIESQSSQGLSQINVRLKLNVSAANALSDISARVNQVRADLPPEAEVPAIAIEPSDSVLASMYLSFGSTILEQNQLTDYLIRVVQPRLSGHYRHHFLPTATLGNTLNSDRVLWCSSLLPSPRRCVSLARRAIAIARCRQTRGRPPCRPYGF